VASPQAAACASYIKGADVTVKNILRSIKNIVLQTDTSWKMKINILNPSGLIHFELPD